MKKYLTETIITLFLLLLLNCCNYKNNKYSKKPISSRGNISSINLKDNNQIILQDSITFDEFEKLRMNEIDSIYFEKILFNSSFRDTSICKKWKLSKKIFIGIIKNSNRIDSNFDINSGGWYDLKLKDTIIRYGCEGNICEKLFLINEKMN